MHQNNDILNLTIHSVLLGNFPSQKFLKNPAHPPFFLLFKIPSAAPFLH